MLTVKQVAEKSGLTIYGVYWAIHSGALGHKKVTDVHGKESYLIDESNFEAWEESPNRKKRKKS